MKYLMSVISNKFENLYMYCILHPTPLLEIAIKYSILMVLRSMAIKKSNSFTPVKPPCYLFPLKCSPSICH